MAVTAACTAVPAAPPAADTGAEAAATAAPAGEAASGEKSRLVIAQSVDIQGMEPSNVNSRAESNIFGHVFGTLYDITETGDIVPYLAKSYTATEDGLQMTFTLNEGLVCHDGEPLTAEDVAYTFMRAADPANAFTGNTAGFVLDGIGFVEARADSDLDVTIVMDKYTPVALGLISEVYLHCKDSYEAMSLEDAAANPIGSGPYKFVEWVKDDYVLLEKVPDFAWKPAAYDELQWKVIPEASTRSAELIAGNVDIITNVPPDQHQAINDGGSAAVTGVNGTRRMYIGYNLGDEFSGTPDGAIIQDPKVRIALQYAVDVPTLCQTLLAFDCTRAASMVNPPNDNQNLEPYPYDPAMAEQLLDEAGYPRGEDGTRFEIGMMAGKGRYLNDVNVVLALAQYLTDVGVKVNLQQMEWGSEFVPLLREHKVGPLFFVGTGGSTWSAVYDMSDISTPDAATNYTEWNNPDWFAGWEEIAQTRDPVEMKAITDRMLEIMYNDPPWLFLYFQPDFYGIGNDVDWEPRRDEIIDATTAAPK
jgi:peptide/nickel transport system substrate-binding protein